MTKNLTDLKSKKLFMLDMDGTLYLGDRLFDGTKEFLRAVRGMGADYIYMTNNSAKSVSAYVDKLARLGIEAAEPEFFTSSQATAYYMKLKYTDEKIYVFGTKSLKSEMRANGFNVTDTLQNGIKCLLIGNDTEMTFSKFDDACRLLKGDIDFIATNPDLVCPTEYGYVPDCGSFCDMLYNATKKRPAVIGKPQPEMPLIAMEKRGLSKADCVIIGDRLYTDIKCGNNAGIDTVFTLSGEGTAEDLKTSDAKPDYIIDDISQLAAVLKR